mgnify:CR=1 FL=1
MTERATSARAMSPGELGDSLARFVWESFTDFLERDPAAGDGSPGMGAVSIRDLVAEELLILFLWVHTQVCQQAFGGRADPARVRAVLDEMHRAVFEDLEARGFSRAQLPLFEQLVSARYSEYYAAASGRAETVGEVAARHVSGTKPVPAWLPRALAEATISTAGPLRDYLDEVVIAG